LLHTFDILKSLILSTAFLVAASTANAQAPVSPVPPGDTLISLEKDSNYLSHQSQTSQLLKDAQSSLDSLFHDHDAIVSTLREKGRQEFDDFVKTAAQTLKELKEEELSLRKELKKELRKTEKTLRKATKKNKNNPEPIKEVQPFNYED
jgi:peptidoglycan hydrolase CwlO-like protein